MSYPPLVSIVIIFWNAERFLSEAIASVLAQTYDAWELLLVDDGSSDGSTQIALEFSEMRRERVRYLAHLDHENKGLSASRNLGVRHCVGEYVAFLDADDVWLPEKLERELQTLVRTPEAAALFGAVEVWYSWTGKSADAARDHQLNIGVKRDRVVKPPESLTAYHPLGRLSPPYPSAVVVRRETFDRVGGFGEEFRGLYEDLTFLSKIYLHETIVLSAGCWVRYRQHADSYCAVVSRKKAWSAERRLFLDWLTNYLREQAVDDSKIWTALKRAQWPNRHPHLYRFSPSYLTRRMASLFRETFWDR